jgi:DNA repair exonuclease SbcCD ATPase subunit
MMTSSDSPTRQIRTIATPQSAGQAREADSEVNKLKEKLSAANHELAAEKAVRSQLERDYQQQSRHADRQLQDLKVQLENATTSKKGVEEVLQKQEARLRRTEACNQELQTQIGALQTELAKKNALLETLQARSKEEDRMHRSEGDCALGSLEQQQQKEETQKNKERLPLAARSDVASVDVRPAASTPKSTHFERGRSGTWTSPDLSKGSTCDVPRRMLFSEAQQSSASEEEEAIRPGSVLAQIRQFENRSRSARSHTPTPQAVRTFTPKRSNWRQEEQASSMATSSSIGHACGTKSGSIVTAPSVDAQSVQRAPLEAQRARTCEIVAPPLDLALATEEMTDAPAFGLSPLARQGSNSSRA